MATHDYVISNGTGSAVRSDLNGALAAIVSQNSNASAPATTYAYMSWADTSAGVMKMRNGANSAWISLYELDGTFLASDISLAAGSAAAPSLFFTGDTNTGIYSPGADQVAISTGGTVRTTIDSSGRLLVGTSTSPSAGSGQYSRFVVQGNTVADSAYLALQRNEAATSIIAGEDLGIINFNDSSGNTFAEIAAYADANAGSGDYPGRLVFSTTADGAASPTEAMRINNQRELLIGTTTRTANGGVLQVSNGITFPATAVACTDVNTLDDYEEGTWTPTVIGTTAAGTVTYSVRNARYTKIGRTVFVETLLNWSAGTGTGNLRVGGLPFTSGSATTTPALALTFCSDITMTASHILTARVADNSTQIEFLSYPSGGGAYATVVYDAAGILGVAGSYSV